MLSTRTPIMDDSLPPPYEEVSSRYVKKVIEEARICVAAVSGPVCKNYALHPPEGYRHNTPVCLIHRAKDGYFLDEDAPEFVHCGGKDCTNYLVSYCRSVRTPCCHVYLCDSCSDLETHFACCDTALEVPDHVQDNYIHFEWQHEPEHDIDLDLIRREFEKDLETCEERHLLLFNELKMTNELISRAYIFVKGCINDTRSSDVSVNLLDRLIEARNKIYVKMENNLRLSVTCEAGFLRFLPLNE